MKKLFAAVVVVGLMAAALPVVAQNDTGTLATGITFISAGATSNALSTAWVEVKNHEEIAVQWRQICSDTNVTAAGKTITMNLGGSMVPSNFVTIATVAVPVDNTATTAKFGGTNLYLGSFRYFGVISATSSATNSTATNTSLTGVAGTINYSFKDRRNGIR